jgi:CubicO group peptidase (beta-lactamase class C family)
MLYFLLILLIAAVFIVLKVFPIISGYGAKSICSNVFICNRLPDDIIRNELRSFPLNLGSYHIDMQQQAVTGRVLGMAKMKAVYKEGLGAILINGTKETNLPIPDQGLHIIPNRDVSLWPNGNEVSNTAKSTVQAMLLDAAIDEAFQDPVSRGTRAIIVVHDGQIVAERYADGFSATSKLAGWSLAKSITSALIGILVKQNKLNHLAPAPIPAWQRDNRRHITLAHLMQMSSGLRWWEYYAAPSDATNMLYRAKSMGEFALQKKLQYEPGTVFNYSSGTTNILSHIIRQSLSERDYYQFPYKELFHKIGMHDTIFEVDAGGTFVGSSYCFATAKDWARFGLLYLQDGVWNGERILPEGWVNFTTTPTPAKMKQPKDGSYGAQWWLNTPADNHPSRYTQVPADCYMCKGYEGQYIWVIPSEKLVVVRLALEQGNELDPNIFLPAVIKAFSK